MKNDLVIVRSATKGGAASDNGMQSYGKSEYITCLSLLRILRTVPIVKTYCCTVEVYSQSLAGESIAMREPCTIRLHYPQSSKLKIYLLRMLLVSSLCPKETGAQASIRTCTFVCRSDCS